MNLGTAAGIVPTVPGVVTLGQQGTSHPQLMTGHSHRAECSRYGQGAATVLGVAKLFAPSPFSTAAEV